MERRINPTPLRALLTTLFVAVGCSGSALTDPDLERFEETLVEVEAFDTDAAVLINEFLPSPSSGSSEWIELYNSSDEAIDIGGYQLDDIREGGSSPYSIPTGTTIAPRGFLAFERTFGLNNTGDEVNLIDASGQLVGTCSYQGNPGQNQSIGRVTDGGSTWQVFAVPTKNASNPPVTVPPSAVVINEVLPSPSGDNSEWIELYNPDDSAIDISGFQLDDTRDGGASPYTLPAGTVISANGFLTFERTFGLNNAGDTVNLVDASGSIVDSYPYTSNPGPDNSIGRMPDGAPTWVVFDHTSTTSPPTKNVSNVNPAAPSATLVINEFLPSPSTGNSEWIELYNPTASAINLSGYRLDDSLDGGAECFVIPENTSIAPNGFLVFERSFGLNNAGDTVNLLDASGAVVDSHQYTSNPGADNSLGRALDGCATWTVFEHTSADSFPTRGQSNYFKEVIEKTIAGDEAYLRFGHSVAVSGDYAIVGKYPGIDEGTAYVYILHRNAGGTNNWGSIKTLRPDLGKMNDEFGYSVAISGEYAVVGQPNGTLSSNLGRVSLFQKDRGGTDNWGHVRTFFGRTDGTRYGHSVSISGDTIVVGESSGNPLSHVYVYQYDAVVSGTWQAGPVLAGDNNFGRSVSISGDNLIVGSKGRAYVFNRNEGGANNWGEVQQIETHDQSFDAVAISGNDAIIGNLGGTFVLHRDEGGANNWGIVKTLLENDYPEGVSNFGYSVALSGDHALVGDTLFGFKSRGAAYIFEKNRGGERNWGRVKRINQSDPGDWDQFGSSLAISDGTVLVGAPGKMLNEHHVGATYVFVK